MNSEVLGKLLAGTPTDKRQQMRELVETMNEVVNLYESRMTTTQNHYGDYLQHATSTFMVMVLLAAGANKQGVTSAAKVNGIL